MVDFSKAAETKLVIEKMLAEGYSQVEVGRRLGISRGQIYNIKSGRTGAGKLSIKRVEAAKEEWSSAGLTASEYSEMTVITASGIFKAEPVTKRSRTLIGKQWYGVQVAMRYDNWGYLEKHCAGKKVYIYDEKGNKVWIPLVTDPETIKRLWDGGELEIKEIGYGYLKNVEKIIIGGE